jgi:hypothetical protein
MIVITTMNPRSRLNEQIEAMKSWSKKFKVYSINTKEEIEKLKDIDFVEFVETDNTFNNSGKNYISLNAMLESCLNLNSNRICLVNSDIILNDSIGINQLRQAYRNGNCIVLGSRWDLNPDNTKKHFDDGFDVFIFKKSMISFLLNDNYAIGLPWWDFWFPLACLINGIKIFRIKDPAFMHRKHPTQYNLETFYMMGNSFQSDVNRITGRNFDHADIGQTCTAVKDMLESHQKIVKIKELKNDEED